MRGPKPRDLPLVDAPGNSRKASRILNCKPKKSGRSSRWTGQLSRCPHSSGLVYNIHVKRCPACAAACWDSHKHCPSCGADVSQALVEPGDPYVGTTLNAKYHITELIGVGAMGRVYRADHLSLDAQVAVKLLNPEVSGDAQTLKRFQTEARAASRLRHPNTIQVLDFGQSDTGTLFLVMELLRGRNLAQVIADEPP